MNVYVVLAALISVFMLCGRATGCCCKNNLALNQPATQSSTQSRTAGVAVDDNRDPIWSGASCTHTTQEVNPWWRVDLGRVFEITKVQIYNRGDCCGERLHDLKITLSDTVGGSETPCGFFKGPSVNGYIHTIDCAQGVKGRHLKIQKTDGTSSYLTLCEVEVY